MSLFYRKTSRGFVLRGYADTDFAGSSDFKSTSGYLFKVNECLERWSTTKQETVALSTCKAEYVFLALAVSDLFL